MNRPVLSVSVALWFFSPVSYGSLITFDPPQAELVVTQSPNHVSFNVTVSGTSFSPIRTLDVLFASQSLRFVDWRFCEGCDFDFTTVKQLDIYPNDLYVGFASLAPNISYSVPFTFGRLTVDTGGLPPGNYSIFVDEPGFCDPFECPDSPQGLATVHVTPESSAATLLLFCLVGTQVLRSRHDLF